MTLTLLVARRLAGDVRWMRLRQMWFLHPFQWCGRPVTTLALPGALARTGPHTKSLTKYIARILPNFGTGPRGTNGRPCLPSLTLSPVRGAVWRHRRTCPAANRQSRRRCPHGHLVAPAAGDAAADRPHAVGVGGVRCQPRVGEGRRVGRQRADPRPVAATAFAPDGNRRLAGAVVGPGEGDPVGADSGDRQASGRGGSGGDHGWVLVRGERHGEAVQHGT